MGGSAFSMALNTYFKKNRAKASGIAYTVTGFGPIVVPQLITWLMSNYNIEGTMLIVSAFALHSLIGATLLQPIEWHMKSDRETYKEMQELNLTSGNSAD